MISLQPVRMRGLSALALFLYAALAVRAQKPETQETWVRWWQQQEQHDDTTLLQKQVDVTELTRVSIFQAEFGAQVHPHPEAVRIGSWAGKPFAFNIGVSVVPFLQGHLDAATGPAVRCYLVPDVAPGSAETGGIVPFSRYRFDCRGLAYPREYRQFPAYYPTIQLGRSGGDAKSSEFEKARPRLIRALQELASESPLFVGLTVPGVDYKREGLRLNDFVTWMKDSRACPAFLEALGLIGRNSVVRTMPLLDGFGPSLVTNSVLFAEPKSISPLCRARGESTPRRIYTLEGIPRSKEPRTPAKVAIKGCESGPGAMTFVCDEKPPWPREIRIGDAVSGRVRLNGENLEVVGEETEAWFTLPPEEPLRTVGISGGIVKGRFRVRWEELGTEAVFLTGASGHGECRITEKLELARALERKPVTLSRDCREFTLTWPAAWGAPRISSGACSRESNGAQRMCYVRRGQPVRAVVGEGWDPVTIQAADIPAPGAPLDLASFVRPAFPARTALGTPLAATAQDARDQTGECAVPQRYQWRSVRFSSGPTDVEWPRPAGADESAPRLPTLREARWPENRPLPATVLIQFTAVPSSIRYISEPSLGWTIGVPGSIKDLRNQLRLVPIAPPSPASLENRAGWRLLTFSSASDCELGTSPRLSLPYGRDTSRQTLEACSFVRAAGANAAGSRLVTECRRVIPGTNGHFSLASLEPVGCVGRRIIVVLELGEQFEVLGGGGVKDALLDTMRKLRGQGYRGCLEFYTLGVGRTLRPIFDWRPFREEPAESDGISPMVAAQLGLVSFGARDLRGLSDLEIVAAEVAGAAEPPRPPAEDIGLFVFITAQEQHVFPAADLGPPLDWKARDIPVVVLATGGCDGWRRRAKAECEQLKVAADMGQKLLSILTRHQ